MSLSRIFRIRLRVQAFSSGTIDVWVSCLQTFNLSFLLRLPSSRNLVPVDDQGCILLENLPHIDSNALLIAQAVNVTSGANEMGGTDFFTLFTVGSADIVDLFARHRGGADAVMETSAAKQKP
jgi:hypothetical protein